LLKILQDLPIQKTYIIKKDSKNWQMLIIIDKKMRNPHRETQKNDK